MAEIVITTRCYLKIVMHSLKYPHATVNGVILAEKRKKKEGGHYLEFVDTIPLIHSSIGLTPMLEMALIQVSNYCKNGSQLIAGYYQANKYFLDSQPNVFAQRIAEKLWENNNDAVMVMVNNYGLASTLQDHNEMDSSLNLYQYFDGKWKQKSGGHRIEDSEKTYNAVQDLVYKSQQHLNLNDFDNHLDDIKCDWTNDEINKLIDDWIKAN